MRHRPSGARNAVTVVALVALVGAMAAFPYLKLRQTKNLSTREEALTGSQVMRGPYINSGSKDVGRDPGLSWKQAGNKRKAKDEDATSS